MLIRGNNNDYFKGLISECNIPGAPFFIYQDNERKEFSLNGGYFFFFLSFLKTFNYLKKMSFFSPIYAVTCIYIYIPNIILFKIKNKRKIMSDKETVICINAAGQNQFLLFLCIFSSYFCEG